MNLVKGFKLKKELSTQEIEADSSFVLKGFRVPQGYVLYIQTKTGDTKTVDAGGFSGGTAKFQDVQNGLVEGWTLQQIQGGSQDIISQYPQPQPNNANNTPQAVEQPAKVTEFQIEEPKWGTSNWIDKCYLVKPETLKKLKKTKVLVDSFEDDKTLRQFLKGNPEWVLAIQDYYKELKDEANISKYSTSAGVSPTFSKGASTPKLKEVMTAILDDALAIESNYVAYSKLLEASKDKYSDSQLQKLGYSLGLHPFTFPPNNDLYSKELTPKLAQMYNIVTGKEAAPQKEDKKETGIPMSTGPKYTPAEPSSYDYDDYDDYDDEDDLSEDSGGSAFFSSLVDKITGTDFEEDAYYYYVDANDGFSGLGSSKYAQDEMGMTESVDDYITISHEDFEKKLKSMTPQEVEAELGPVIKNYFFKNAAGEFVTKGEVLETLKEQIETLPEEEKFLLRKQINLGGLAQIDEDDVNYILESIRNSGYGYDKVVSFEEFDKMVDKVEGRALEMQDFPKIKIEGLSYQQSRFEVLKKLISESSYQKTFTDMNAGNTYSEQPFSDFASEVIRDYIEYLGGDGDLADELFRDFVIDNNKMHVSLSATIMRLLECEETGEEYSTLPDSLKSAGVVEKSALAKLDTYRATYKALKSAHQDIFNSMYPDGSKVGRVFVVPSPSDEEIQNFDITLSQVSSFSTASSGYLLNTFAGAGSVHRPGGNTPVYVSTEIKSDKVVMLPNLFGWQSHWRNNSEGGKHLVIRQAIPNKRSSEMEVIVSGRQCVTLQAELTKIYASNRNMTVLDAKVRLL